MTVLIKLNFLLIMFIFSFAIVATANYTALAAKVATVYAVNPLHLLAICKAETGLKKPRYRTGRHGERGICQVRRKTWNWLGCIGNPRKILPSLLCAAKYIEQIMVRCKTTRLSEIAHRYNTGNSGRCRKNPTTPYISRVLYHFKKLQEQAFLRKSK